MQMFVTISKLWLCNTLKPNEQVKYCEESAERQVMFQRHMSLHL